MKTIGWNVDTQQDFMYETGALYVQGAEEIIPNLETLTKIFSRTNTQVVNTADHHNPRSPEISEEPDYVNTFPEHCMIGTTGASYIPETKPERAVYIHPWDESVYGGDIIQHRNIVLYKDAFNVFTGTKHTIPVLELTRADNIIVYGVATNVCVDYAVQGLRDRGKEVYVVLDAIKELPGLPSPIPQWKKRGVRFTTTNEVSDLLEELSR